MAPIAKDTDYEQASNNRPMSIRVGGIFLDTRYPKKCFMQIYRKLYWCPPDGQQYGGRKPTETSVTEFSYKGVDFSHEELINIKVILFLIH